MWAAEQISKLKINESTDILEADETAALVALKTLYENGKTDEDIKEDFMTAFNTTKIEITLASWKVEKTLLEISKAFLSISQAGDNSSILTTDGVPDWLIPFLNTKSEMWILRQTLITDIFGISTQKRYWASQEIKKANHDGIIGQHTDSGVDQIYRNVKKYLDDNEELIGDDVSDVVQGGEIVIADPEIFKDSETILSGSYAELLSDLDDSNKKTCVDGILWESILAPLGVEMVEGAFDDAWKTTLVLQIPASLPLTTGQTLTQDMAKDMFLIATAAQAGEDSFVYQEKLWAFLKAHWDKFDDWTLSFANLKGLYTATTSQLTDFHSKVAEQVSAVFVDTSAEWKFKRQLLSPIFQNILKNNPNFVDAIDTWTEADHGTQLTTIFTNLLPETSSGT